MTDDRDLIFVKLCFNSLGGGASVVQEIHGYTRLYVHVFCCQLSLKLSDNVLSVNSGLLLFLFFFAVSLLSI